MAVLSPDARLPASAGPLASPEQPPLPGTCAWFVFFVCWIGALMLAALYVPDRWGYASIPALRVALLAAMCFYLSLCNAFLPLPTAWIVLLAGRPEYAPVQSLWLRIPLVAALLALATVIANLNEYHLLACFLRRGLGQRIRQARLYGWAARLFARSPFELLALVAFVPIPVDAVRWLAILGRYSRLRFALAYFAGRGLRYVLLVACALCFQFTWVQILLIQAALVAAALGARGVAALVRRSTAGNHS